MSSCQRMLGHWCPGLDFVQRKAHEYLKKNTYFILNIITTWKLLLLKCIGESDMYKSYSNVMFLFADYGIQCHYVFNTQVKSKNLDSAMMTF